METDYSREIYDRYYNVMDKIVVLTLKDNTVMEGRLVSFFHGDPESNDPFVVKWHFVEEKELETYLAGLETAMDGNQGIGRIILQKDIRQVDFRNELNPRSFS